MRRGLLFASLIFLLISNTRVLAQAQMFDLRSVSVKDIQAAVAAGTLSYERLVQLYLNRIEAYDKNGPRLNAILYVHPRALEIARALDEERLTKGLRSSIHGIPIAIKDNVDVNDMPTTGGSQALAGSIPAQDATVVRKLRDAGAIIFLKTNMDEFARSSQGLSSLGGQTLNPYDLKRNPGGSSAGTGVAVNVGFATLGIATETGVSVRSPASNNSLVGIAATQGLVSRAGVIPVSFTQDRVGVHAKSVADAALLLTVIRGYDPEDLFTAESLGRLTKPYTDYLDARGLVGARLGVLRDLFRKGEQFAAVNNIIDREIALMRDQRSIVIDGLTTGTDLVSLFPILRLNDFEMRPAFDAYLRRRGPASPIKTFAELVASGKFLKSMEPLFQQVLKMEPLDFNSEYASRLEQRLNLRQLLIDLMDRYGVAALVYPFKSLAAPLIGTPDSGTRDNPVSAISGLPAIVIPAGVDQEGLPISIELLGRPFSEPQLIRLAYAYEQASQRRVVPPITPPLRQEALRR